MFRFGSDVAAAHLNIERTFATQRSLEATLKRFAPTTDFMQPQTIHILFIIVVRRSA